MPSSVIASPELVEGPKGEAISSLIRQTHCWSIKHEIASSPFDSLPSVVRSGLLAKTASSSPDDTSLYLGIHVLRLIDVGRFSEPSEL